MVPCRDTPRRARASIVRDTEASTTKRTCCSLLAPSEASAEGSWWKDSSTAGSLVSAIRLSSWPSGVPSMTQIQSACSRVARLQTNTVPRSERLFQGSRRLKAFKRLQPSCMRSSYGGSAVTSAILATHTTAATIWEAVLEFRKSVDGRTSVRTRRGGGRAVAATRRPGSNPRRSGLPSFAHDPGEGCPP